MTALVSFGSPTDEGSDATGAPEQWISQDWYLLLIERLSAEFAHFMPQPALNAIAHRCQADLSGTPAGAMPELTERLARHRICELLAHRRSE
ncbi:MAG: hypothetical protein QOE89_1601 [Pseudonocardiales bacterium]|jgi:hypothetical protein|nr:hypothetical protein [Pseudonocardiales bacterium]